MGRYATGTSTGDSEIFPRFDFNLSSSALSSSAYGRYLPARQPRLACRPFAERGKSLEMLYEEHKVKMANQKSEFERMKDEVARTIETRNKRNHTDKHLQVRHESSSKHIRKCLEIF